MILNINFKKYRESIFFKTQILSVNEQEHVKITHVEARLGFPSGSGVKDQPAIQEPQEQQIQSLGGEDPLEEGTATHSSILAWEQQKAQFLIVILCWNHSFGLLGEINILELISPAF